jgi:hypothetical protein
VIRAVTSAACIGTLALALSAPALARPAMTKGVANAALAAAARATPVRAIDYDEDRCDSRTVAQWLTALTAGQARSVVWTGGPCEIVGPGIDSGSDWCARAEVTLKSPLSSDDTPMIEVFFERPRRGRPGRAYAFRGVMQAADGQDMSRFRKDFEADWISRFPAPPGAVVDCRQAGG